MVVVPMGGTVQASFRILRAAWVRPHRGPVDVGSSQAGSKAVGGLPRVERPKSAVLPGPSRAERAPSDPGTRSIACGARRLAVQSPVVARTGPHLVAPVTVSCH
jgi:hypothetical protein